MSLKLLDLAVAEAVDDLPTNAREHHFLNQPHNIEAAKAMIVGDTTAVPPGKRWLYGIVNNAESGALLSLCSLSDGQPRAAESCGLFAPGRT